MATYRLTDVLGFNQEFEAPMDSTVAFDIAQDMLYDWYDDGFGFEDYPGGFLYRLNANDDWVLLYEDVGISLG